MNYLIITENDESQWDDKTGEYYHFPSKYKNKLVKGAKVIYYKGKRKNKNFIRLSNDPHYFGIAEIGDIEKDLSENSKNSFYARIENYQPFISAVDFKDADGTYLENVRTKNYFRDGVRVIDDTIYSKILLETNLFKNSDPEEEITGKSFVSFGIEGRKKVRYSTTYERDQNCVIQPLLYMVQHANVVISILKNLMAISAKTLYMYTT